MLELLMDTLVGSCISTRPHIICETADVLYLGLCEARDVVGVPSWSAEASPMSIVEARSQGIGACKGQGISSREIVGDVSHST